MATKLKKEVKAAPVKEAKKVKKEVVVKDEKVVVKEATPKKVVTPKIKKVKETISISPEAVSDKKKSNSVTVEELFEAGAHFGHVVKKWNPKMNRYLWGAKNGIHILES
jgi:hypothetical protein